MKSVACLCLAALLLFVTVVVAAQDHNGPYEDDSGWEHAVAETGTSYDSHYETTHRYRPYENDWKHQMYASAGSQSSVNMAMIFASAVMVIARVALR